MSDMFEFGEEITRLLTTLKDKECEAIVVVHREENGFVGFLGEWEPESLIFVMKQLCIKGELDLEVVGQALIEIAKDDDKQEKRFKDLLKGDAE